MNFVKGNQQRIVTKQEAGSLKKVIKLVRQINGEKEGQYILLIAEMKEEISLQILWTLKG